MKMMRTGGEILIDALKANGVDTVFCVPGESYLAALDALHDAKRDIKVITCRQEGGAAFMAEAYAKLTGKPGVCFVTRGPGACNASIGVHTAKQDSTPLILLVGQVARDMRGREAFQEIDYRDFFQPPITKWAEEIDETKRIPEFVARAFAIAKGGRPGPVVLALPEDMLTETSDVKDLPAQPVEHASPTADGLKKFQTLLNKAKKPIMIVGGGAWCDDQSRAVAAFAAHAGLPVAVTFRRQDAVENTHPHYVGTLGTTVDQKLLKSIASADLIIAVGTRLGEIATQSYELIAPPRPKQKLVHVYPDAAELGRVYQADLALVSDTLDFAEAGLKLKINDKAWKPWLKSLRQDYVGWSTLKHVPKFKLDIDGVYEQFLKLLPADAVITTDAGNFSGWAQRYIQYGRKRRLLAPTSGAMGYGVPSAVAASIAHPGRTVVGLMGDGGFMMTGQELATAMHHNAQPILIVFNNSMYGTIRMHQEKHYPARVSSTDLTNPDFAALAQSYGAKGFRVEKTADFAPAFKAALKEKRPSVIELVMDPQQITTSKKLSEISKG